MSRAPMAFAAPFAHRLRGGFAAAGLPLLALALAVPTQARYVPPPATAQPPPVELSAATAPTVRAEVARLALIENDAAARNPAQKKMSMELLYSIRAALGRPAVEGVAEGIRVRDVGRRFRVGRADPHGRRRELRDANGVKSTTSLLMQSAVPWGARVVGNNVLVFSTGDVSNPSDFPVSAVLPYPAIVQAQ